MEYKSDLLSAGGIFGDYSNGVLFCKWICKKEDYLKIRVCCIGYISNTTDSIFALFSEKYYIFSEAILALQEFSLCAKKSTNNQKKYKS